MDDHRETRSGAAGNEERQHLVAAIGAQLGSRREARWIVEFAGPDRAQALADRRAAGEPLQYVLGRWPFRSLDLRVDRRALIPRPETEQVVEAALAQLAGLMAARARGHPGGTDGVAVDLGTGTGAIALSLAVEGGGHGSRLEVWATDASADALEVARANLDDLARTDPPAAAQVHLAHGRWFAALPPDLQGRVDLVVANPPYVSETDYPALDPGVRDWEPPAALVSGGGSTGVGGMADIESIVAAAPRWLRRPGALVVEIAPSQGAAALDAARRAGFAAAETAPDLAGRLRMLVARR